MRWSPSEFWASTLTEFMVAVEFWCDANGVKKSDGETLSRERLEELKAKYG
ncbi:phage tail assembly chaperone [Bradyrhizobium sp. STM 3561]|uniref:phage tail assembly chaperone n=1 Tax=Bradyrhizobium sp. STM 3561 TaxID=578923 RepID=UPI003890F29B